MSPRITVVIVTCREEWESTMTQWQEIAESIRLGEESQYGPMSLVDDFSGLLLDCVKPDMVSFLEPTLESLCHQTFRDFEVIIVDWFADERKGISEKYSDDLDIIHVRDKPSPWHDMKPPEGMEGKTLRPFPAVNNARNTAIIRASGEAVCFLDDHIVLETTCMDAVWRWHRKGRGIKFITNRYDVEDHKIRLYREFRDDSDYDRLWIDGWHPYNYRGAWSHGFATALENLLKVNGFEEVILDGTVGAEDIDLGTRLCNLLERPEQKSMIALDTDGLIWEIGHPHIHRDRPQVRFNMGLLDIIRDWNRDVLANQRKPTDGELELYKEEIKRRGEKLHPYWRRFPVEPFNLREKREEYSLYQPKPKEK